LSPPFFALPKTPVAPAAPSGGGGVHHVQAVLWNDPTTWGTLLGAVGSLAVNLALAIGILALTVWAANWAATVVARSIGRLHRGRAAADRTLEGFAASLARYVVIIIGLIAVLGQLGVKTTSIIAVLGAASLAVGLALQGTLSNVAAGVMLLLFRRYRVGDDVEIAGKRGTVRSLDLFATEMADPDNVRVVVPNSKAFGDLIINYSKPAKRRMELHFGIDYADDIDQALDLLIACAKADERIIDTPAPWSKVTELGDSSVRVTLRAWAMPSVYWNTRYDMIKRVKQAFDVAGLHFPYPHQVGLSRAEAMAPSSAPKPRRPRKTSEARQSEPEKPK
jgi:small conductance mechanosensitive channel